tara:strand:+ start:260 stop:508 length:249 start_codon:yes stop_codon:yes gene_type:complete
MSCRYTKMPITIEAVQWTGENIEEINSFVGVKAVWDDETGALSIKTLEGNHNALISDYIIKGIKGEFYPCKSDIFKLTYKIE